MLPRFLIADNSQENIDILYVVHTQSPRCIIQCDVDDFYSNQKIHWLDETPNDLDIIENLLEEAENFFEKELAHQEELYDEEDEL